MHKYGAKAILQCIEQHRIVLVGDSQIRQMFWALAMKLNRQKAEEEVAIADKHTDLSFTGPGSVSIDFIWDPYLNSSRLLRELTRAAAEDSTPTNSTSPSIIMIGGGLWFAKTFSDFSLQRYSESVETILQTLGSYNPDQSHVDNVLWRLPQRDHTSTLVMFAPVQRPHFTSLDPGHAKTLTPARIQRLYEKLLQSWQKYKFPVLWVYDAMTKDQPIAFMPDGIHVVEEVSEAMVDVLLNVKCNDYLTAIGKYPMDKTCCSRYPQVNTVQLSFFYVAWSYPLVAWLLPWMLEPVVKIINAKTHGGSPDIRGSRFRSIHDFGPLRYLPPRTIWNAIAILLSAANYCWLTDRTHLYSKASKQYSSTSFAVLCFMAFVLGIISIYRSRGPTQKQKACKTSSSEDCFLSRDQTDEWKGWMQMIILIYHYTGASRVLWIYKIARLLVAAYLFLTGYGHTIFFRNKADYSLRRVAGVLIRLNMLTCILPYVMQTDYLFYYFAPLVSFWYLVVFCTMAIGRSWNGILLFLIFKILLSAVIVTILIKPWPGVLTTNISYLSKFCGLHWDATDWGFRLRLDKYIVYFGMLVAAYTATNKGENAVCYTTAEDRISPKAQGLRKAQLRLPQSEIFRAYLDDKRCVYLATTCSGCLFYALFAYPASSKEAHNRIFPIASVGPILAFVALRNLSLWRGCYSGAFAWVGRHSLETFILQYHVWLAADTKGVLSTGLFDRNTEMGKWLDFALLTLLFLWVCRHVADATQTLTAYIVDPKSAREGETSEKDLPTEEDMDQQAKYLNGEVVVVHGAALGLALFRGVTILRRFVAQSLWMRLFIISLALWALSVAS